MSKVIDITSKLTNDRPKLKITNDLEVEIDNRKNTVFEVQKMLSDEGDTSVDIIDRVLEKLIGKDPVKELNELDLSFDNYQTIFVAAMSGATGEDFEVVEARFRETRTSK